LCLSAAVVVCDNDRVITQREIDPLPSEAPPSEILSGGARPEEFLFYGGFDLWRFSLAGYTGLYWAPTDRTTTASRSNCS
jgi:hypothetical protein